MTKLMSVHNLSYIHKTRKGLLSAERIFNLGPIDFDIHAGETIAVIGNNGSGKSLLAKTLAGAIKAHTGTIKFYKDNAEISAVDDSKQHLLRLILEHEKDSMNPALAVGSVMHNTLKLNTKLNEANRQKKIDDTLKMVGLLHDHYYYYRHMLSDGQQQRVALARALLLDPKIIVADEPFAALDPSVRSQTVNLILKLQHELGLGFVFISHNMGIVRHISDRVLVMDKGKIIEQGKTEDVFTHAQNQMTQKIVQSHANLVERHINNTLE